MSRESTTTAQKAIGALADAKHGEEGVLAAQGPYIDPVEAPPPDRSGWDELRRAVFDGPAATAFVAVLRVGDLDVRASILDDLAQYHQLSPEECRQRCIHWEQWSVDEWRAGDRSTPEGIQAFYDSVASWAFDLLWHAYLQTTGHAFPLAQLAAHLAKQVHPDAESHLDFGSGAGVLGQLFERLGYRSTSADICAPLLKFARWRAARHAQNISFVDLRTENLPDDAYDVVTAIDTLVHVDDLDAALANLHRAMRPDGWLIANFDVRSTEDDASAWHLHNDDLVLDRQLKKAGFAYRLAAYNLRCYQRLDRRSQAYRLSEAAEIFRYPLRRLKRRALQLWARS
jgi:2-polyprenyl-3-methyl-5-hydroxy-6-metoxy-1,4-benzoquinol methylase